MFQPVRVAKILKRTPRTNSSSNPIIALRFAQPSFMMKHKFIKALLNKLFTLHLFLLQNLGLL